MLLKAFHGGQNRPAILAVLDGLAGDEAKPTGVFMGLPDFFGRYSHDDYLSSKGLEVP